MRPPGLFAGLLFLLALSAGVNAAETTSPNWTLTTPDGQSVELEQVSKDRPQIILFWATWCPYCKALMPHLQSIQLEYGDKFGVLAINIKEDGDPEEFMAKAGYDFTLLLHGDLVAEEYEIVGTPSVIIVDTRQKIRFDLRQLPGPDLGPNGEKLTRPQKVQRLAPYWAAEIRKALDHL